MSRVEARRMAHTHAVSTCRGAVATSKLWLEVPAQVEAGAVKGSRQNDVASVLPRTGGAVRVGVRTHLFLARTLVWARARARGAELTGAHAFLQVWRGGRVIVAPDHPPAAEHQGALPFSPLGGFSPYHGAMCP